MNNSKNNIEDRIRDEYQGMKLPDTDMSALVKVRIEAGEAGYRGGSSTHNRHKGMKMKPLRFVRIAAIAALFAVMITCTSAGIYAAYNGITISQVFTLLWGGSVPGGIQDTISCEAVLVSESNGFEGLDIKPVRVIGDKRGIYVVFELKADDGHMAQLLSDGRTAFRDYSLEYEDSGSGSCDMYMPGRKDNAWYVAVKYLGGEDGRLVSDNGRITVRLDDLYRYDSVSNGELYVDEPDVDTDADADADIGTGADIDADTDTEADTDTDSRDDSRIILKGSYEAVISYDYIDNNVEFVHDGCKLGVSALTVMASFDDEQDYYDKIDKNVTITLKNGGKVKAEFIYGLEYDNEYTSIYSINRPVEPVDVTGAVYTDNED